ncbi:RTA1-domain-containing protein [Decorospora gaudefroyi]|uniref:RTA1-domain-containing protein n=1 Tax=Decorospora gaudefroyi TaxID=184978 RepID=A0A6A5KRV7_9PLEO|nr:RTA1-domain-containing protein [Decorospora gaudefroyi]
MGVSRITDPDDSMYWGYRPSLSTNIAFAVLFALSMIAFMIQGIAGKRWLGFTIAMSSGCAVEVVGYIGRILAHDGLGSQDPFLLQIICLTIGPAFLAAGIYLCLSRIVTTVGPEHSRLKPLSYPRIFIPCDCISLVLQAAGGGMASIATINGRNPERGNNVMIAGLAFQVATLLFFILLASDFAWRTCRRQNNFGQTAVEHQRAKLRSSWSFKAFLGTLSLSTLLIFTRCVFRVAELSEGWGGHLAITQKYFIGLEGAVIIVAVILLNICHPGFCFKDAQPSKRRESAHNHGDESRTELVDIGVASDERRGRVLEEIEKEGCD